MKSDWRIVDRALRTIAQRRAGLDAEEARWIREAEVLQIWRPLGMVSMLDYLERAMGYSPRTGQDEPDRQDRRRCARNRRGLCRRHEGSDHRACGPHRAGRAGEAGPVGKIDVRAGAIDERYIDDRTATITAPVGHIEARRSGEASPVGKIGAHVGATAEDQLRAAEVQDERPSHERPCPLDIAVRRTQTKDALVQLGWKPAIASAAVTAALAVVGSHATLEQLIFEALRRCPRPFATAARTARAT